MTFVLRRALLASAAMGHDKPALHLTATTTGAGETVTIHRVTPAVDTTLTIIWGDGTTTSVAAGETTEQAHVYAAAGTHTIRVVDARNIVQIDLHDSKLSGFDSGELRNSAVTYFACYSLGSAVASRVSSADMALWTPTSWLLSSMPAGGTYNIDSADMALWTPTTWWLSGMPAGGTYNIDSADMALWTPTSWLLYSMPAGGTYNIDSADMALWTPTTWWLYSMPAGGTYSIDSADMADWTPTSWLLSSMPAGTYNIDSADMADWTPTDWRLYSMPAGTLTVTAAANFNGWLRPTELRFDDLTLNQAQVDAILTGLYSAFAGKTSTGGTLHLGGSGGTANAAPSGTFQAASVCSPTDGKEIAYELLNDTCNVSSKHWATVTITA